MGTEEIELKFTDDAIDEIANIAVEINASIENIGARRLQTVMEKILEEISFTAPDLPEENFTIDADYVRKQLGSLVRDVDLSHYIL